MSDNSISRKSFLKRFGAASLAGVGAVGFLASCGGGDSKKPEASASKPMAAKDPCDDLTGLTEADLQPRKTFKYVKESPDQSKLCSNCALYKEPEAGSSCGGCTLIKGPIHPDGYCTAWAAKPQG